MKSLLVLIAVIMVGSANADFSEKTNGEFVTLSGKVSNVKGDSFTLNTNGNQILVEMDDYSSWIKDGFKLVNGDRVVVSGMVDRDFLEKKKVEAGSVYVKNIDTYFFASSDDEEDVTYISPVVTIVPAMPEGALVDIQGKITKVEGREFTVDTGFRTIQVDTKDLAFNPMDDKGFTELDVGDRVRVSGEVEDNIFEPKEVAANYVNELPKAI